jgi:enoyl-CoA hydratase/carnithine racemase
MQGSEPVTIERRGALAAIWIDNPPVNALNNGIRQALDTAFDGLIGDPAVHGVMIACRGRSFVVGADIRELSLGVRPPYLGDMLRRIADSGKTFVAATHGPAMGGGCEIALACTRRVASADAIFALPEIKLGLLPGAGGTQRLPRLIGVAAALELMLTGCSVSADEALKLGLIDQIAEGDVTDCGWAESAGVAAARNGPEPEDADRSIAAARSFVSASETLRNLPAAAMVIEAVRAAVHLPPAEGFARERELFFACRETPEAKALLQRFLAERAARRQARLDRQPITR